MAQGIEDVIKAAETVLKLRPVVRVQVKKGDVISQPYSNSEKQIERIYSFPDLTIPKPIRDYALAEHGEEPTEAEIIQQGVEWLVFSIGYKGFNIGTIPASDLRNMGIAELSAKHALSNEAKHRLYDDFYRYDRNTTVGDDTVILYKKGHSFKK